MDKGEIQAIRRLSRPHVLAHPRLNRGACSRGDPNSWHAGGDIVGQALQDLARELAGG